MGAFSPNIIANSFICRTQHAPQGEIMICGDRRITWGEFTPRVLRVAQALVRDGVRKGDKVAFMFHNIPEFLEVNCGIQVAGAVPSPVNYRFIAKEIEYQVNHSDARAFIYDGLWAETVEAAAPRLEQIKRFVRKGDGALRNAISYVEFIDSVDNNDPAIRTDWDDVAVMIYTGGTTGFPKGVVLTYGAHRDMWASFLAHVIVRSLTAEVSRAKHKKMMETMPIPGGKLLGPLFRTRTAKRIFSRPQTRQKLEDRFHKMLSDPQPGQDFYRQDRKYTYPSMPFFHDASYAVLMLVFMAGSGTFVMFPNVKFDPGVVLEAIERESITNVGNVPTGWKKLVSLEGKDHYDLTAVRIATTGGGVCPSELKKQILETFPNAMLLDVFGQTEMTPVTSFRLDFHPKTIKDRSVGKSIVEVRVVDEQGQDVKQGAVGEILYSSSTVMRGYYKDEEKTQEVMEGGWFRSGDLGYIDEIGEIRVVDRKKECINTGGEKVFPLEVEEVLQGYPKVEAVCVIGAPDQEWGSTVRAVVQLKAGEGADAEEILSFCRGKLAGYKIPRSVIFVDEIPLSPVGKVLRQKVRELYGHAL